MARTAPAEGQKRSPGSESRSEDRTTRAQREPAEPAAAGVAVVAAPQQPAAPAPSATDGRAQTPAEDAPGLEAPVPGSSGPVGEALASPRAGTEGAPPPDAAPAPPSEASGEEAAQLAAIAEDARPEPLPADASASTQRGGQAEGPDSSSPEAANALRAQGPGTPARREGPEGTGARSGLDVLAKGEPPVSRETGSAQPASDPSDQSGAERGVTPSGPATPSAAATAAQASDPAAAPPEPGAPAQAPATLATPSQDDSTETRGEQRRSARRESAAAARPAPASGAGGEALRLSGLRAEAGDAPPDPGPTPAPVAHAPSGTAPAPVPAPVLQAAPGSFASGGAPQASARLGEMIDAIHATIELAARRGSSQARIALRPAELGDIRIHLSQSAEGLVARVTADTPEAAQALAAGRGELHQSLSSLGTALLRLDVGLAGGHQGTGREIAGRHDGAGGASARTPTGAEESISEVEAEGAASAAAPNGGALGALVDVLA